MTEMNMKEYLKPFTEEKNAQLVTCGAMKSTHLLQYNINSFFQLLKYQIKIKIVVCQGS